MSKKTDCLVYFVDKENARPLKKGDIVTIIGRRWFDNRAGSSYFSAIGYVNGEVVVRIPFESGYDEGFLDRTWETMVSAGYAPDAEKYNNGGIERLWRYCERTGVKRITSVSDVARQKDL